MAIYMWREYDGLCFTADTAWSTVQLVKTGSPTSVNLETSTNSTTWSDYTIWDTITLSNIWDRIFIRNKSTTPTNFSTSTSNFYKFVFTWGIIASWNVNYLLCKNSTDTLTSNYCFYRLFVSQAALKTPPSLPATTLTDYCYSQMFFGSTNMNSIPYLPATTLSNYCYNEMFTSCVSVKVSETQTWIYQTEYRIPKTGTGTTWTNSLNNMFSYTWWAFTWTPSINTTYYTSNTLV